MEPLIDALADKGLWGLAGVIVVWLMREQIAAALRPADRTSPNELTAAFKENTEAMRLFVQHLTANTKTVEEMRVQVSTITNLMQQINAQLLVLVEQGRKR